MKSRMLVLVVALIAVLCSTRAVFGASTIGSAHRVQLGATMSPPVHEGSSHRHGRPAGFHLAMWLQLLAAGLAIGAVRVKDVTMSSAKYVQRAQAAGPAYQAGVAAAGPTWQTNTVAAQSTWAAGVADAANRQAFSKGVQAAGASKYEANASGKGAQRYPQGVATAQSSWQTGVQPYMSVIAGLNLPPRQPKGNPANYARVQAVADALRAKKVAGH